MGNFNRDRGGRSSNRRGNDRNSGPREMHRAICDECGQSCEVPFKPTGNKPIFCSHCFEKQGGSSSSRRDNRHDSGRGGRDFSRPSNNRDRKMYSAVCAECGDDCEVPFKPTSDKPIFCSNCFAQREGQTSNREKGSREDNRSNTFEKQLRVINEKLDQILQGLNSNSNKKSAKRVIKKEIEKEIINESPVQKKAVAKKKPIKKVVAKKKSIKKAVAKKKTAPKKKVVKKVIKKKIASKKK